MSLEENINNNMKDSGELKVKEFPKEDAKIHEKTKEKENLLRDLARSNDYEITKDNTMASTTCATKIGDFFVLFLFLFVVVYEK